MMYKIWMKEVARVIGLRFKDQDVSNFEGLADWKRHYDNKLTAHEAVTIAL